MKNKVKSINKLSIALLALMMALSGSFSLFPGIEVMAASGTQSVTFSASPYQNQTKTITVPNLTGVSSITTNTGNVGYTISGNNITINASNGDYVSREAYTDPQYYSDYVTSYSTSSSNSFASTKSYSSGGYSGTLSKNGVSYQNGGSYTPSSSTYVTGQTSSSYNSGGYSGSLSSYLYSGSYTPSESRTATSSKTYIGFQDFRWSGSSWISAGNAGVGSRPSCVPYNSGGYSGSICEINGHHTLDVWHPEPTNPSVGQIWRSNDVQFVANYSGTVTKPAVDTRVYRYQGNVTKPASDTRTYRQDYVGTAYMSGTAYRNYQYAYIATVTYTTNEAPILHVTNANITLAGANDTITFTGTINDHENDSVIISAKLGGKTEATTIPNGNGTWKLHFKGADIEESVYSSIQVYASDSIEVVSKIFSFPNLTIDNTMPFFWAITHTPTAPTNREVSIQINVGDTNTGVKSVIFPDGTTTSRVNSVYKVTGNGDYDFTVEDNAGNTYTQTVSIDNIDSILPVATALTLHDKGNGKYQVTVKATDASGIQSITLNDGGIVPKEADKDVYSLAFVGAAPTHINITDKAGNVALGIPFLTGPTISLNDYNESTTKRTDITGTVNGSDELSYQIGSKKYTCANKPCAIAITKNNTISAINQIGNKATIKSMDISNIDKKVVNIVLDGIPNVSNPGEIIFSWDEKLTNPKIICTTAGGITKEFTPTSNPFTVLLDNQYYNCHLFGEYEGIEIESPPLIIYPDFEADIIQTTPSDSYDKKTIQKNTFVEKNLSGKTFYINFNKDNSEEQIPIPSVLLK